MEIIIMILLIFIIIVLAVYIQVFIHEFGHLIGAKLTRFKFVSFSVGNFILYKKNGKLKFKKSIIPALGQCLVYPSEKSENKKSFRLYFISGGLANLLTTIIFISLLLLGDHSLYIRVLLSALIFFGVIFTLLSLLPVRALMNDGHTLRTLSEDKNNIDNLYTYLKIVKLSADGKPFSEMPDEYFNIPKGKTDNVVTSSLLFYIFSRYIEKKDFDSAKQIWLDYENYLHGVIKYEFEVILIFYETLTKRRPEIINKTFEGDVGKYIQSTRWQRLTLFYAIELLINENHQLADECLKGLNKISKKMIYDGLVKANYMLVDLVEQYYNDSKQITIKEKNQTLNDA